MEDVHLRGLEDIRGEFASMRFVRTWVCRIYIVPPYHPGRIGMDIECMFELYLPFSQRGCTAECCIRRVLHYTFICVLARIYLTVTLS